MSKDVIKTSESEESVPLLQDELTSVERAQLQQTVLSPGFKVIVKLANAGCKYFNDDVIKLNPESPNYDSRVIKRQLKAWVASKYSNILFKAIAWHVEQVHRTQQADEQDAADAVKKTFGINVIDPKKKALFQQPRIKTVK